jgi:hypothetical protein
MQLRIFNRKNCEPLCPQRRCQIANLVVNTQAMRDYFEETHVPTSLIFGPQVTSPLSTLKALSQASLDSKFGTVSTVKLALAAGGELVAEIHIKTRVHTVVTSILGNHESRTLPN